MVTSNKLPDKRIVKMADANNSVVVPQRTLLGEVNEHITCPLCRGYYIDATTIVECLHSFCRSCIIKHLQVKSYCPVCEMMINSAKPNIKLDKALQDIVYKLVPGLFQKEMDRRQQFYASRPGPAATATPEQRGEDTERIIFSPEDVISFSLEYADVNDTDSVSSKSSDSNEAQPQSATSRRYLQCPAVVNISHLKKFLSMKFDIDSTQYAIDVLYKRVPLPDCYTLMDIAYIYNWKRNEPMRFFYQITDDVSIRNRLFDVNKKTSHFHDRKPSPGSKEDRNANSPESNMNYQFSEASSDNNSPMPEDNARRSIHENIKNNEKKEQLNDKKQDSIESIPRKKDDEVEKSQFLNSFELTAKSSAGNNKSPSSKNETIDKIQSKPNELPKTRDTAEDTLKRKHSSSFSSFIEMKKLKVELEKTKLSGISNSSVTIPAPLSNQSVKTSDISPKLKNNEDLAKNSKTHSSSTASKEAKQQSPHVKPNTENSTTRKPVSGEQTGSPQKRKPIETASMLPPASPSMQPITQKTVSPLKLQIPKPDISSNAKTSEVPKSTTKKMPDLKPSPPPSHLSYNSKQPINKIRMDLLANNSDPTIDRSKILSQVKSSLNTPIPHPTGSGDPLKSLFDSCKINIPSSLSITLTDQKSEPRSGENPPVSDQKNNSNSVVNKPLSTASNTTAHKVPSSSVHNYIEILKLPDSDPKKPTKPEGASEAKTNLSDKSDVSQAKPVNKSETSTKGPVPNLKPIADTKLGKQNSNASGPITFQQTFEKQLQTLQTDKKTKVPKNKAQVPKLMPATPKTLNKVNIPSSKTNISGPSPTDPKQSAAALDLSTPHNFQSQLTPHQSKAFETMQSIVNLAKKQNFNQSKPMPITQGNMFASLSNRTLATSVSPSRTPSTNINNPIKHDTTSANTSQVGTKRQDLPNKVNQMKPSTTPSVPTIGFQMQQPNMSPTPTQPSPRQTRSPSSSPKLVIAEEKQGSNSSMEHCNQSNQITSTQLSNPNAQKAETSKSSSPNPGPSKPVVKQIKPVPTANKITGIRQPITPTIKSSPTLNTPTDFLTQPQLISAQHAINLRHQMELQWLKARQFLSNIHDFNKDKQ